MISNFCGVMSHYLIAVVIICVVQAKSASITTKETDNGERALIDLAHFGERIFGVPVVAEGDSRALSLDENSQLNPEELGPYLEGDLLVPIDEIPLYRNGLIAYSTHWPAATVPYEIRGRFNDRELSMIAYAFNEYHTKTCIRFKPRTNERDYIVITGYSTGCWSSAGRLGGRQVVNLQRSLCFLHYGTSIHELMHVLGFLHEHSRPERDGYIRVLSENVKNGLMVNFAKGSPRDQSGFGVPYDYASVMHYSRTSFSKNGKPTIEALRNTKEAKLMGQRAGFSSGDIAKLNAMYRCR